MMPEISLAPVVFVLGLFLLSALAYGYALQRGTAGRSVFARSQAVPATWSASEAWLVFILFFIMNIVAAFTAVATSSFLVGDEAGGGQVTVALIVVFSYVFNLPTIAIVFHYASQAGPPAATLGMGGVPFGKSAFGGALAFLLFLPVHAIFAIAVNLIWQYVLNVEPRQQALVGLFGDAGFALMAVLVLTAVVLAPLFEEIIFRGFIQRGIERSWGRRAGVVVTALLFAAVHMEISGRDGILDTLAVGVVLLPLSFFLSLLYVYTRNIITNIVFHAAFNAMSVAVVIIMRLAETQ